MQRNIIKKRLMSYSRCWTGSSLHGGSCRGISLKRDSCHILGDGLGLACMEAHAEEYH